MNTGQTILTIGALVLLGFTVLLTNRGSLQDGAIINQTEVDIYSVSLAESIIEEASGKAFDHYSASDTAGNGNVITALSQLSTTLGKESDDTLTYSPAHYYFDDFDDYNTFSSRPFVQYVSGVDSFHIWASVFYVDHYKPGSSGYRPDVAQEDDCKSLAHDHTVGRQQPETGHGHDVIHLQLLVVQVILWAQVASSTS